MSKFFISYSHDSKTDNGLAVWLRDALRKAGHDVFVDTDIPLGAKWGAEIERRINWCDFLIVLLSEASAASEMVADEVRRARNSLRTHGQPRILPVRVNYTGDPGYELSAYLNPIQWMNWAGEADSGPLLDAVLRAASDPTAPLPQPVENKRSTQPKKAAFPRPVPTASGAPSGSVWADDPFYLRRDADDTAIKLAANQGVTLIIEAPRQIGKSSLMQRYLAECQQAGKRTAMVDLAGLPFDSFNELLTAIAAELCEEFDLGDGAEPKIAEQQQFTLWVQRRILKRIEEPITLAFDEADSVLDQDYREAFFSMLRAWHNRRARVNSPWRMLDLALVISTEPHLLIDDPTLSPFNVGNHIRLRPFTPEECLRLNQLYRQLTGQAITDAQVGRLREMLGGQPFLTRLAYHLLLVERTYKFDDLLRIADRDESPFSDHLRALLSRLQARPDYNLASALKQVIHESGHESGHEGGREGGTAEQSAVDRLAAAGLVRREGRRVAPANGLYARFFGRAL
jgi:hypothetical protein